MERMTVRVTSLGGSDEVAIGHSEDLAWEHAVMLAENIGMELGSDDFAHIYERFRGRYKDCALSFGFLHNLATRTLKELMESGMAVTFPPGESEEKINLRFHVLVAAIFTSIAWSYACGPDAWIPNQEWDEHSEDERSIDFYVVKPTLGTKEGTNENA
jgi:hypothetical protein